ncbi:hypothetical protein BB029_12055 [Pseudomonas sp. S3E12]|nr:hypothetical protein BB029_12055 [Pseudomonas sp. S3E12]
MQNSEAHRETLHSMAAKFGESRVNRSIQKFDKNEMADEAYWNSIEEFQSSTDRYRGSSSYDVVRSGRINCLAQYVVKQSLTPRAGPHLLRGRIRIATDKAGRKMLTNLKYNQG